MSILDAKVLMNEELQRKIIKTIPNLENNYRDTRILAVAHYVDAIRLIRSGVSPDSIIELWTDILKVANETNVK